VKPTCAKEATEH